MIGLLAICVLTAAYSLVGERLSRTPLTAPMFFVGLGVAFSVTGLIDVQAARSILHPVAEVALVILLFLDAARTDFAALRMRHTWPMRMLVVGLPLAIVFGVLAGLVFLPGWSIVSLALIAAILAPTDAALGQAVISNVAVPIRERRALTVESGLNDGLALPAVLFFAAMAAATAEQGTGDWVVFAIKQITLGPLVGAAVGAVGGWALLRAKKHGTTSAIFEGIGALALAGTAYLAATQVGGNGFIAAFAGGLAFGKVVKGSCSFVYEFTESEGQLLSWSAFFLLGVALVPQAIASLTLPMLGLILTSLFVIRPLAIWLSLLGTDARPMTRLFFGWFGPRGLATALFALLVTESLPHALGEDILLLAINMVWISVILHGVTANPAAWRYGKQAVHDDGHSSPEPPK